MTFPTAHNLIIWWLGQTLLRQYEPCFASNYGMKSCQLGLCAFMFPFQSGWYHLLHAMEVAEDRVIDNNSHVSLIGRSQSCEFVVSIEVDLKSIHLKYKLYTLTLFLFHIWIGYVNISQSLIFDVVYNKMA